MEQQRYEFHVAKIQSRAHDIDLEHQAQIRRLHADIAGHVQDKQRHNIEASAELDSVITRGAVEVQRLHRNYKSHIDDLNLELLTTKNDLARSKLKCDSLEQSPFCRATSRKKKDLSELSQTGGHARRLKAHIW